MQVESSKVSKLSYQEPTVWTINRLPKGEIMSLRAKSDEQQKNEAYVLRAAKELAKKHIADAIQATIIELTSIKWELSPGHEGTHLSRETKEGGEFVANRAMKHLLDDSPINYRQTVNEANEDDDVIDEDTIQDGIRNYVEDVMRKWQE